MTTIITNLTIDTLRYEVFNYLNTVELGFIGLVCKTFYDTARQEDVWQGFPHTPREDRFRIHGEIAQDEWDQLGVKSLENRMIEFIGRAVVPGQVALFRAVFANCPEASISLWMGEGVAPSLSAPAVEERWAILGNHVAGQQVHCFRPSDLADFNTQFKANGKRPCQTSRRGSYGNALDIASPYSQRTERPAYRDLAAAFQLVCGRPLTEILPQRWFWMSHDNVIAWEFAPGWYEGSAARVTRAAEGSIYRRDVESVSAHVANRPS